ncbi:MAG: hypothetical protein PUB51_00875 [Oscillospiraceae bacterium]|nr:hypothetical protein [Oscillospiraceae bacterium]
MKGSTILKLDAAMRGNKVIYWLGRIPLIRRLVSDTLYSAKEGKLALSVLLWIWRIIKSFGGTILYLALLCVLPTLLLADPLDTLPNFFGVFCWLLFCLSFLSGSLLNPCAVAADQLKYTCVRMMGMNAGRFHLWAEVKHHAEYFVTFTVGLLICAAVYGQSLWMALLLSVELSCARLVFEWLHIAVYRRRGRAIYGQVWFTLTVVFAGPILAYVPGLALELSLPNTLILWALPAFLVLGALSLIALIRYPDYYRLTLDTCQADKVSPELARQKNKGAAFKDVQLQSSDLTAEGEYASLSGWNYLQALFFRRHRRMMYKPLRICLIVVAIATAAGAIALLIFRGEDTAEVFSAVTRALPFCVFFLYLIDSNIVGTRITKAMFYNCDLAMLKFGWYRQRDVILKNFMLRFSRMCGVNLLLSAAVCGMFTVFTLCAGGRPPLGQYLAFMAALLCLGVFFAVHSLGMYYLFQPYTSDLQMKNPFFGIINGVMYVLCYTCIQIRSTPSWFTLVVLIVTVVYSAAILLLVRKRSPSRFRVK